LETGVTVEIAAYLLGCSILSVVGSLSDKLAAALGIAVPGPVQELYNRYRKHLEPIVVSTPLPEEVSFLPENFPYLIQLENPNPADTVEWVPAKASEVLPPLIARQFDQTGFRFEELRANALFNLPDLLRKPNCIHKNLRHGLVGGISGDFMYVGYYGKKKRKVAFTIRNQKLNKIVVVSSFWTYKSWVKDCADNPAIYVSPGCTCTC
jgi:hypothetical protein